MIGATKFLLDVTLISPDLTEKQELKLRVELAKSNRGYGNDTYMLVKSRDKDGTFEQLCDIRYRKEFDKRKPEAFIVDWVYSYWTGENGSWHVTGCSIKASGIRKIQSK